MKNRVLLAVIAIVLVGIFALMYYQAAQNAPLEYGEYQEVRGLDLQMLGYLRHPGDSNEVIRGFEFLSKGGYKATCYYQPNAKNPILIENLDMKSDGLYYEEMKAPIYRVYPFGIKVQEGTATLYNVYWMDEPTREHVPPYHLEEW